MKLHFKHLVFIKKAVEAYYRQQASETLFDKEMNVRGKESFEKDNPDKEHGWDAWISRCDAQLKEIDEHRDTVFKWLKEQDDSDILFR